MKSLYRQVVDITEDFLGPAGERFIRRQIQTHLGIEPEKLTQKHLPELVKWAGLAFALLTNQTEHVKEYKQSLLALTTSGKRAHVGKG